MSGDLAGCLQVLTNYVRSGGSLPPAARLNLVKEIGGTYLEELAVDILNCPDDPARAENLLLEFQSFVPSRDNQKLCTVAEKEEVTSPFGVKLSELISENKNQPSEPFGSSLGELMTGRETRAPTKPDWATNVKLREEVYQILKNSEGYQMLRKALRDMMGTMRLKNVQKEAGRADAGRPLAEIVNRQREKIEELGGRLGQLEKLKQAGIEKKNAEDKRVILDLRKAVDDHKNTIRCLEEKMRNEYTPTSEYDYVMGKFVDATTKLRISEIEVRDLNLDLKHLRGQMEKERQMYCFRLSQVQSDVLRLTSLLYSHNSNYNASRRSRK